MYEAKGERASHIYLVRVQVDNGQLVELADDEDPRLKGAPVAPVAPIETSDSNLAPE